MRTLENPNRGFLLYNRRMKPRVIYWISRALRTTENQALYAAQQAALSQQTELVVWFNLRPDFPHATTRSMHFLLSGLAEVAQKLHTLNIPLVVTEGDAWTNLQTLHTQHPISAVFTEHNPLRPIKMTHDVVATWCGDQSIRFTRVNTACVIPVWDASPKLEFSAKTIRNKLMSHYEPYLDQVYPIVSHPFNTNVSLNFTREDVDRLINQHAWQALSLSNLVPGEEAALAQLDRFIHNGLDHYDRRNEVDSNGQSHLSAYLHFGMLSPLTMIRKVKATGHPNAPLFIEEAMVRRELAENFVHYCAEYDSLKGAWSWAQKTLDLHRDDPRDYLYTREQFETAQTHDPVWNACQRMVINDGYLHSYLRMYWAKMVLLWSRSPEEAIATLIHLNDTYFLDGRDPNGYTGILWSVAGVHDRPWFDKPIHGLIRAMGIDGTLKKTKLRV